MIATLRDIKIELSRRDFWEYCKTSEPDFYKESRPHLKRLCGTLNDFYYGKLLKDDGSPYTKLMIRIPPQHGKSRTLVNYTKWCLGKNNQERIITGSWGDSAASDFARYTRDGISEVANLEKQIVFSDIFPGTKIKHGNASVQKWALEGQHFNYLGVGYGGGVTGKGATLRIIDDLVKDAEAALNDTTLNKLWVWLSGTFSSRNSAEEGEVREIFCATLWGENDPQYILEQTEKGEWYVLSMPIYDAEKDEMLCSDFMSKQAFEKLKKRMLVDSRTTMIFHANYMCEAISDNESKVFAKSSLQYYDKLPEEEYFTIGQIDPADEGDDHFSFPIARVYGNYVYIVDAIFDQENLTLQEPKVQAKHKVHRFAEVVIETNNAGAYFRRRLEDLIPDLNTYGNWAKATKMPRIIQYAGLVKLYFRFPNNPTPALQKLMIQLWKLKSTSKKEDDAGDSISGLAAHLEKHYGIFNE
jgi:hypothetical protein